MNKVWSSIIITSILYMLFSSNASQLTTVLYEGVESAVELGISLVGIMALWGGFMEIAERSGITSIFAKVLSPIIKLIFPNVKTAKTKEAISMNITANILGLGNAATPLGIEAMKRLDSENNYSKTASNSMITFVIINTASVQLVPVTTAVLRAKYGSINPMSIMMPVLCASFSALVVGIALDSILKRYSFK